MEIVELGAADVQSSLDDLAQLLLDGHDAGAALGLAAPLDLDRARLVWAETANRLQQLVARFRLESDPAWDESEADDEYEAEYALTGSSPSATATSSRPSVAM